jgi:hypothetical protein
VPLVAEEEFEYPVVGGRQDGRNGVHIGKYNAFLKRRNVPGTLYRVFFVLFQSDSS